MKVVPITGVQVVLYPLLSWDGSGRTKVEKWALSLGDSKICSEMSASLNRQGGSKGLRDKGQSRLKQLVSGNGDCGG